MQGNTGNPARHVRSLEPAITYGDLLRGTKGDDELTWSRLLHTIQVPQYRKTCDQEA